MTGDICELLGVGSGWVIDDDDGSRRECPLLAADLLVRVADRGDGVGQLRVASGCRPGVRGREPQHLAVVSVSGVAQCVERRRGFAVGDVGPNDADPIRLCGKRFESLRVVRLVTCQGRRGDDQRRAAGVDVAGDLE